MCLIGSAVAWPLAARAQQGDRVRRIGVLILGDENDPVNKLRVSAFIQALAGLGWRDGPNVQIVPRWGGDDINRIGALVLWSDHVGAIVEGGKRKVIPLRTAENVS
jgi:putative ABC transport system substrate-binding protein